jgi:hypothetical protein
MIFIQTFIEIEEYTNGYTQDATSCGEYFPCGNQHEAVRAPY